MTDVAAAPDPAGAAIEEIPLATTLDESTLRRVFQEAPLEIGVPTGARALFRARMKTFGGSFRLPMLVVAGAVLAIAAMTLLAGEPAVAAFVAGIVLIPALVIGVLQYGKAVDDFFDRYATARGLGHVEDGHVDAGVPLLRRGDKREFPRVLSGSIAGQDARLAHFTYTEVSRDSDGNREETDYDYTVLHFRLPSAVAARFRGVYCSPKGISLGALQDKLAHDRKVELESVEFHKRYSLRVVDEQDDVALYELFSTTFIHRLATELQVHWEQCGEDLVVWSRGHEANAADLDRFCLEAWHVLHRYLEEWQ